MRAETIFFLIIMLVSMTPIVIIGIVQYKSKNPVGFWSGKKPPQKEQITDVKAYNRKHGLMWILYGMGCIFCCVCGLPFGDGVSACLCMIEIIGGVFIIIAYHNKLERMYRKKDGDK